LLSREFLTLGLATMLFFAGMGASNPLLPKFVVDELGGSETSAGFVMGTFAVAALVTRSSFGRMGGRKGSRRLMVIGTLLGALGMVVVSVAGSLAVAILSRLILGTAQAALMTGATVLAIELAPPARRGEAASYVLVSFHLGLGLGPVAAEKLLAATSYRTVWLVLAAMMVAGTLVASALPHRPGDRDAPPAPWIHPAGLAPGMSAAFGIVAFVTFSTFVPLYARTLGMEDVGAVFMVASISIAVARLVFGKVPDLIGPIRSDTIALVLTAAGAVIAAGWAAVPGIYAAAAVLAAGMSLQTPSLIPVAVYGVPDHERASAMATFTMFMDLSVALTGPVMGLVVAGLGYRAAFLTGGAMAIAAIVVVFTKLAPHWASAQLSHPRENREVAPS
jgi:MFS family permease